MLYQTKPLGLLLYTVPEFELQEGLCQTPSQYKDVQPGMKRILVSCAVVTSKPHISSML